MTQRPLVIKNVFHSFSSIVIFLDCFCFVVVALIDLTTMSAGTPPDVVVSRSGRVRKKSAKLMEMEEVETSEKQGEKRSSCGTPRRAPKSKPVKLKMTIGGTPVCEVVEEAEVPIEVADVVLEEPQLEIVTEEPPLPLPPITMKLSASKGTSELGPSTLKSLEAVSEKRPSSRNESRIETPKTTSRKRKATVQDVSPDLSMTIPAAVPIKPTPTKKNRKVNLEGKVKKPTITGYTLWTKENRPKIQQENPEMDFPAVSRRLGEIWQSLSNNEKLHWKVKAQRMAGRMSSTGTATPEPSPQPSSISPTVRQPKQKSHHSPLPFTTVPQPAEPLTTIENKMRNIPMTVAAHLKVLGESMSTIGHRLSQQESADLSVPLSNLLDSILCSLNSLMFLTCLDPKLNGCPLSTHHRAMDNVAYIMPGI